jgi:hypothetical protein
MFQNISHVMLPSPERRPLLPTQNEENYTAATNAIGHRHPSTACISRKETLLGGMFLAAAAVLLGLAAMSHSVSSKDTQNHTRLRGSSYDMEGAAWPHWLFPGDTDVPPMEPVENAISDSRDTESLFNDTDVGHTEAIPMPTASPMEDAVTIAPTNKTQTNEEVFEDQNDVVTVDSTAALDAQKDDANPAPTSQPTISATTESTKDNENDTVVNNQVVVDDRDDVYANVNDTTVSKETTAPQESSENQQVVPDGINTEVLNHQISQGGTLNDDTDADRDEMILQVNESSGSSDEVDTSLIDSTSTDQSAEESPQANNDEDQKQVIALDGNFDQVEGSDDGSVANDCDATDCNHDASESTTSVDKSLEHGNGDQFVSSNKQLKRLDSDWEDIGADESKLFAPSDEFGQPSLDHESLPATNYSESTGVSSDYRSSLSGEDEAISSATSAPTASISTHTADLILAGLLIDDKAFYFPMNISAMKSSNHHHKGSSLQSDWMSSWDKKNSKDLAALSEYYRAKGESLLALNGVSDKKTKERKHSKLKWTEDWQHDPLRAVKLGKMYLKIAAIIDAHYSSANQKEDTASSWLDDQKQGMSLVRHLRKLASIIADHYTELTGLTETKESVEESSLLLSYQMQGFHAANDYEIKASEIEKLLNAVYSYSIGVEDQDAAEDDTQKLLIKKGKHVCSYYRARFDPSYKEEMKAELPDHYPDKDFPQWGHDWRADQAHGIAIGQYWKQYNYVTEKYYQTQGEKLQHFYEKYYQMQFQLS